MSIGGGLVLHRGVKAFPLIGSMRPRLYGE